MKTLLHLGLVAVMIYCYAELWPVFAVVPQLYIRVGALLPGVF